jgi:DNA-binding FrmR family transcriptional regulator
MATDTATTPGCSATKEQLSKRLCRSEDQVRGIEKMVEDDRYCIGVLTQISAIQAALDKAALGLLDDTPATLRGRSRRRRAPGDDRRAHGGGRPSHAPRLVRLSRRLERGC